MSAEKYDVIVIGGGPAGSSVANFLVRQGREVLLLEREKFPRFHVGESLLPAAWDLWDDLGVTEEIDNAGFVVKQGVNFAFGPDKNITLLTREFPEYFQRPYTYHVERAKFDEILLRKAESLGVDVREGWLVKDVIMEGDRAVGVVAGPMGGEAQPFHASVIVDATGRDCIIGRKLGMHRDDTVLNKISYWTHIRGGYREILDSSCRTDIQTIDDGWIWYIPLADDIVSVGPVLDTKKIKSWPEKTPQDRFDRAISECECISKWMEGSTQIKPIQVVSNVSYLNEKFVGDGYILIGDASMFIDPVFSAGVTLAMRSAKFAAESIEHGLDAGDCCAENMTDYEVKFRKPVGRVFKLIHNWYDILERGDRDNIFFRSQRIPLLRERLIVMLSGGYDRADMDELLAEAAAMAE